MMRPSDLRQIERDGALSRGDGREVYVHWAEEADCPACRTDHAAPSHGAGSATHAGAKPGHRGARGSPDAGGAQRACAGQ